MVIWPEPAAPKVWPSPPAPGDLLSTLTSPAWPELDWTLLPALSVAVRSIQAVAVPWPMFVGSAWAVEVALSAKVLVAAAPVGPKLALTLATPLVASETLA